MEQIDSQMSDLRAILPPSQQRSGSNSAFPPPSRYGGRLGGASSEASTPPPSALHGDNSAPRPSFYSMTSSHSLGSQEGEGRGSVGANKRKSDDAEFDDEGAPGGKGMRSKRNRYISIACNECKRRKIKCNGETPCQRCGNLSLQCVYAPNCCTNNFKDSDEYREMAAQVAKLQEQFDSMVNTMNMLQRETSRLQTPAHDRILPLPVTRSPSASSAMSMQRPRLAPTRVVPSFNGPTSMEFTLDVAKNTLHELGYRGHGENNDGEDPGARTSDDSPNLTPPLPPVQIGPPRREKDPLWEFDKEDMIRLCRVYEEEINIMFPLLDIEKLIQHARNLTTFMEAAKRNNLVPDFGQGNGINDTRTLELKMVMCSALTIEEHCNSPRAERLLASMASILENKLFDEPASFESLPLLGALGGYRWLSNDELLAWRVMGHVGRLCMELGLHRREGLAKISDESERRAARTTFWTAYILDRRWSFATGLPYVIHDDHVDPKLEGPGHPFMVAMVSYSRLAAKVWKLVDYFDSALIQDLKAEYFESLDREALEWYENVPDEVKMHRHGAEMPIPSTPSYNLQRLQIWTYLRLNQIRIWLHTPILHSASSIIENMPLAQRAVDLAKETIRFLTRLNSQTNLYRKIQVLYHQYLTGAIAVLFLAVTHYPLKFSPDCRTEFYMALELVRDFSGKSWVSQRLWRTIKSLKSYAPQLGLNEGGDGEMGRTAPGLGAAGSGTEQYRRATQALSPPVASPGSAGRGSLPPLASPLNGIHARSSTSGTPPITPGQGLHPPPPIPTSNTTPTGLGTGPVNDANNGQRLQHEMSRIFEGFYNISNQNIQPLHQLPAYIPGPGLPVAGTPSPGSAGSVGVQGQAYGAIGGDGTGSGSDGSGVYQSFKNMF